MLPFVIAYNASVPTKFMPSPNQRGYIAHKKYAMVADLLGLGGHTIEEKVQNLVTAIEQLLDWLAIPRSIASWESPKRSLSALCPTGQDRLRRSFRAVEPAHATAERIG